MRGVLFDAALVWAATGLTTVKFNAATTPQETTLLGVSDATIGVLGLRWQP
jgi:hypothetical protein